MPATQVLSERTAIFDYVTEYTERALADSRVQNALGSLATHLLERVQTAYLPNVDERGVVTMPKGHMDTDHVAVLPVIREGGSHFLSPDWFMPPIHLIRAAKPMLQNLWPDKDDDELQEVVTSRSLSEHAQADYFSTDILPYFRDGDAFGPIAALLHNRVWSLWQGHKISARIPPIVLLGSISIEDGSGYGHASTLTHEFSHVVQDDYIGIEASRLSGELFAYRNCSTILRQFVDDIAPEVLEDNEFSLEVEEMRARVNTDDDPFAEHEDLVQLFAERMTEAGLEEIA